MSIKQRIKPEGIGHSYLILLGGLLIMGIGLCSSYVIFKGFSYDPDFDIRDNWGAILVTIVWSLGFILAGIWFLRRSRLRYNIRDKFDKESIETNAKVVNHFEETIEASGPYDDDRILRYVIVQFESSSGQVTLRADISKKVFDLISSKELVKIRYADTNPRIALLESE